MKENDMSLIQWEPFAEAETAFNRLMSSSFARWPRGLREGNGGKLEWSPSADISETEQEYVIRAELPAVKKEDVRVTLDEGTITIKGERKQQNEDKSEKYHRIESFYGSFERTFMLPENIKADSIRCDSKDGILTVHIPKSQTQKSKPKQISVS
jgi:HSP20 family protein